MKFKKSVPIILAALALSAALIGCSGGATSSGSQTTDVPEPPLQMLPLKILLLKLKNLLL